MIVLILLLLNLFLALLALVYVTEVAVIQHVLALRLLRQPLILVRQRQQIRGVNEFLILFWRFFEGGVLELGVHGGGGVLVLHHFLIFPLLHRLSL